MHTYLCTETILLMDIRLCACDILQIKQKFYSIIYFLKIYNQKISNLYSLFDLCSVPTHSAKIHYFNVENSN